jgi:O-antigen/teichoic acid export membrane protein
MSTIGSDLKRIASSSGLYAIGEVLNRGLAFLLLPVYTRFLPQEEYGALDLFNAFSGVLFACLLLGMPSALTKVYHRDCRNDEERATALPTALLLDLPLLLVGGGLVFFFAEPLARVIIGREGMGDLVRLLVSTAVSASLTAIVLSSFRTREKPLFFVGINLLQFVPAMALNIVLVVHLGWGIRGVLFGNLVSSLVALPVGLWLANRSSTLRFNRRLVKPLLHFGVLLIPVTLASWVIDLSDRYVLRIFHDLEQNAIYGVGYKIGMILQMAIVWPFQLAWPAVSFSISKREGHQATYARTLTYFTALLAFGFLGLSLLARQGLPLLAGEAYRESVRVVPWVALAYLLNGIHFCLAPGIHIKGYTRYLPLFSGAAAAINLGLNFLVIPRFGVVGAAWTTTFTFFFLAVATAVLSWQVYPVDYELKRIAHIAGVAVVIYTTAVIFEPAGAWTGLGWHLLLAAVGFPLLLLATGFLHTDERTALAASWRRLRGSGGPS